MGFTFVSFVVIAIAATASGSPLAPMADLAISAGRHDCGPVHCAGTNNTHDNPYFCGDSRLGPKILPKRLPLNNLVDNYDRLGGLCPGAFLKKWYNDTGSSYIYPPLNGFQLNMMAKPIQGNVTLRVGTKLDRFGSDSGFFVSPAGAPYMQRALPPSNLDTPPNDPSFPYNYRVYSVIKEFVVLSGPVTAWFGQPGQGTQYQTYSNISSLVDGCFLKPMDPKSL